MTDCNIFVTMMWGAATHGKDSPYNASHVNNIYHMLERTQKGRFKLFCLGDASDQLHEKIEFLKMPDPVKEMIVRHGGHFSKLYLFSQEFRDIIGDKFLYLDLDAVIFDDLSDLFKSDKGLLILEGSRLEKIAKFADPDQYEVGRSPAGFLRTLVKRGVVAAVFYMVYGGKKWCKFNSSIVMIARDDHDMWEGFDPVHARQAIAAAKIIGTDQAWLHLSYPGDYTFLTRSGGFWRHKNLRSHASRTGKLPGGIRFVAFPGPKEQPWSFKDKVVLKDILDHYPNRDIGENTGSK